MSKCELIIEPFVPSEASESAWQKFFALKQAVHVAERPDPDDVPIPDEAMRKFILNADPHHTYFRWIAWTPDKTEVVGCAVLRGHSPGNPGYESNKHIGHLRVEVHPQYRRRGLGKELARVAVGVAGDERIWTLQEYAMCDEGRAFCAALGGNIAIEGAANILKLNEVDWDMIEQWIDEGPKRAEGVRVELFHEVPEADLEQYCRIYTETMNQQPMGELEGEMIDSPERRRSDEARSRKNGIDWLTMISRERDGTISGLTEVIRIGGEEHRMIQQLTGVDHRYRGRGLGKWLKAAMLMHIRSKYPGVKMIMTGNANENAPMLTINQRMGFRRYLSETEYKFNLETLCQRLEC